MALIVITNDTLDGARSVIDEVSLPELAAVGWAPVGPWCGMPGSTATDAEWAAEQEPPRPKKKPAARTPKEQ